MKNVEEDVVVKKEIEGQRAAAYYVQMMIKEEENKEGEVDGIFETVGDTDTSSLEDLKLLEDMGIQDLCMKCLEETILNIVDEAANGEFQMDTLPKAYVVRQSE